jgi:hypothetical protein
MRSWVRRRLLRRRVFLTLALASGIGFSPLFAPPNAGAGGDPFGCVGDCNQTGRVELNELVTCSLGVLHGPDRTLRCFDVCDANGDGVITIGELVLAVNYALGGCPP